MSNILLLIFLLFLLMGCNEHKEKEIKEVIISVLNFPNKGKYEDTLFFEFEIIPPTSVKELRGVMCFDDIFLDNFEIKERCKNFVAFPDEPYILRFSAKVKTNETKSIDGTFKICYLYEHIFVAYGCVTKREGEICKYKIKEKNRGYLKIREINQYFENNKVIYKIVIYYPYDKDIYSYNQNVENVCRGNGKKDKILINFRIPGIYNKTIEREIKYGENEIIFEVDPKYFVEYEPRKDIVISLYYIVMERKNFGKIYLNSKE